MNFSQYQALAMRTAKAMGTKNLDLLHAGLGLISEAGELATMTKAHVFYNKPFSRENAIEEMGDILWFTALAASVLGKDLSDIVSKTSVKMNTFQQSPEHAVGMPTYGTQSMSFLGSVCEILAYTSGVHNHIYIRTFFLSAVRRNDALLICDTLRLVVRAVARAASTLSIDLEAIAISNIIKLKKRYPDKYSDQAARERADKQGENT